MTLGWPGAFTSEEWRVQPFLKSANRSRGTQVSHACQGLGSFSSHESPYLACFPEEHSGDLWTHTWVVHEWALIKAQGFKSSRFPEGNLSNHSSFILRILSSWRKQDGFLSRSNLVSGVLFLGVFYLMFYGCCSLFTQSESFHGALDAGKYSEESMVPWWRAVSSPSRLASDSAQASGQLGSCTPAW